ncbi:hypothetical protein OSB04_un001493 [Centaurea solstitialis]|uniref:F-box domain-containing protein n=1 Tax=Centaurea solstitialis TaxID=347529 RepID=A0AA38SLQ2_9ASTR|nr:hypothetical protein OSB04_un001493 [Centaurea solstitialis]
MAEESMADFLPHLCLRTLMDPSMEALPVELTIDILSRLPVKTIIHCKLVCKKWRSLVLDSSFVNLHLSKSPLTAFVIHHKPRVCTNANLIVLNDRGTLNWVVEKEDKVDHHHLYHDRFLTFDLNSLFLNIRNTLMLQVGSVNGLICLGQFSLKANVYDTYICNPVTREYMILPTQSPQTDGLLGVVYGFGVSSLTGEYKVVRAFQAKKKYGVKHTDQPSVLEAEVYTLGTGRWRSLVPVPVTYWLNKFYQFYGPFLNNHCHWIVSDRKDVHDTIGTFDLDKETFQLFPSPPPSEAIEENNFHRQSLAILNGCLCKLDTYHSELTIWVMKEYGIKNSWHKEVVIKRDITVDLKWPSYKAVHLIMGLKDGSILMVFENKLCVFDPHSDTIEDTKMFDHYLSGFAYRPSFLKLQNFKSERRYLSYPETYLINLISTTLTRPSINPSMEGLPAELTMDILSRLPAKTIIHCKLVGKKWRNLVSDSSFVDLHLSRSPTGIIIHQSPPMNMTDWNIPNDPGVLKWVEMEDKAHHYLLHYDSLMSLDVNLVPVLQNSRILNIGSVNGLIFLWQHKHDNTYICNPVTREILILPGLHYHKQDYGRIIYGFGVSSLTGEYKVVRTFQGSVLSNGRPSVIEAQVYTLGTGHWRSLGGVPYQLNGFRFCGLFLNNHCRWIVSDQEDASKKLCTFDLDKETFQFFPSPPPEAIQGNQSHRQSLAVLKGCLCILDTYDSEVMIWVMKEYGIKNSWHKEVVMTLEWPLFKPIRLIEVLKDGSILMVFGKKLRVFNPRSETINDTKMFDPDLSGLAYRPSFLKLQNFESERIDMF